MRARMLRRLSRPRSPDFWDLEARRRAALADVIAQVDDDELLALIHDQSADDRKIKITRIAERSLYEALVGDLMLIDTIASEMAAEDYAGELHGVAP